MNKIEIALGHQHRKQFKLYGLLIMLTIAGLTIGFKEGNIFFILLGLIPISIIGYLIYLSYKKDLELTECLKEIKQRKVTIQKSVKMYDREILLLSKEGSIPKVGFKNLICVTPRRNKIYWMASLVSEIHEQYNDFEMLNGSIEAITSNNYLATINPDTGEIIHSRLNKKP